MTLRVQLFGEFRLWRGKEDLTPALTHLGKPKTLFKIFITHPGRIFSQDELIELLWPEAPADTSAANLRKRISELRQVLEPKLARGSDSQYILTRPGGYCFNPQAPCTTDMQKFLQAWEAGQKLERAGRLGPAIREYEAAATLATGDLLAEDRYEPWALDLSREWEERHLALWERLGECEARLGHFNRAIAWVRKGLAKQPLRESFYEQWMLYAYLSGEPSQALKAYEECVRLFQEQLQSPPSLSLAGLREQILQGRVIGVDRYRVSQRTRRPAQTLGRLPFVGRADDFNRLLEQLEAVCAGQGRAIFISGEAGVGKTRLIQELDSYARRSHRARVLRGQGQELKQLAGFHPLSEAITDELLLLTRPELESLPASCLAEVAELVPELRVRLRVLGLPVAPPPEPGHTRRLEGLTQLFTGLASAKRPLVLWLDDLHWADPSTLDFIEHFLPRLTEHTLLFIGAYRSEELLPNPRLTALLREGLRNATLALLQLDRLPLGAYDALVEQLAPTLPKRELLSRCLHEQTKGNPFFLTAALQSFFETGVIQQKGGSWQTEVDHVTANYKELYISPSLRELVLKRIKRLGGEERQVLEWAAVLGQTVEAGLLKSAAGGASAELAESLTWAQLLTVKVGEPRPGYEFSHDLIREVVYANIEAERRRQLHGKVAQILEARSGDKPSEAAVIAQHFEQAGELEKALEYMLKAHEHALENYRHHEALALAERARSLLDELRRHDQTEKSLREKLWAVLEAMDRTLYCLRERQRQLEIIEKLIEIAQELGDLSKLYDALYRKAYVQEKLGRYREALTNAREALEICERPGGPASNRPWALILLGNIYVALGEPERARACLEEALSLLQGDPRGIFDCWRGLRAVYQELGQYERVLEYAQQAVELSPQVNDEGFAAWSWSELGLAHYNFGEYERALECIERSLQMYLSIGNRPDILFIHRGLAHHGLGHYAQAREFYEKEIKTSRESGQLLETVHSLRALAQVYLDLKQPDQALALVDEALKFAREMASPSLILLCLTTKTRVHLQLNQSPEALRYSQEAVGILERGQPYAAPQEVCFAHALALCANQRTPDAQAYLTRAHQELMARAELIADPERRASFCNNVRSNREILATWEREQDA